MLTAAFEFLVAEALAQPQVFVHRDYHSRNLMITSERNPGIIDFQDALRGPVGYDLVSLLKDCYISWPRARVEGWVRDYRLMMHKRGSLSAGTNDAQMLRWFDVIGVQRHLKVLGIFARLWYRDGKSGYLNDLPLTLRYVVEACARFPQLRPLREFLLEHALPALPAANAREAPRSRAPHEGHAARRRSRRTHAAPDRSHAQALADRGRQAAHRLASGSPGARRRARGDRESVLARARRSAPHWAMGGSSALQIQYSEEGSPPLETGGGIFQALPLLGPAPFLVVNGDTFTDIDPGRAAAVRGGRCAPGAGAQSAAAPPAAILTWTGSGSCDGDVRPLTYSGIGIFSPALFAGCAAGPFPLLPLFKRAIAAGRLQGQRHTGQWRDIGTPERLAALKRELAQKGRPALT